MYVIKNTVIVNFRSIYKNVYNFPQCNKIMKDILFEKVGDMGPVNRFFSKYNIRNNILDAIKCQKAMLYVLDIDIKSNFYNVTKESGFLYLNYWLYNNIKADDKSRETQKIYEALLKDHKSIYTDSNCLEFKHYTITSTHIKWINKMYSMYECLNGMKHKDESYSIDPLCNALKDFINKYESEVQNDTEKSQNPTLFDKCKNNTRVPTIIITIVALLISIVFLVLYKTPIGSYFQSLLIRKRNDCNIMDSETNNLQPPSISQCASNYNKYDILYHCN
ncbi:variable surface protein [Plasmodium gonderi]|uniref:Variable surface protein n=1 Tax=Plasmodium gonderi TaxID=77519 RepID=A0A1Y1JPY2_PLAGO|nr:variable surface protein [Plasmodium gonderi]GAW84509.1 variable surface protein [Plasmodium gonderi]